MTKNETTEKTRKRLIFRSEHRGTKEMDMLMGTFARKYVPDFSEAELAQYDEILKENDPNLYNWITGKEDPPANVVSDVFDKLKAHKYA
ncbi:MAG: succinate dehydrogenase assembly factor 2 [Pseudomonadota bacterium]